MLDTSQLLQAPSLIEAWPRNKPAVALYLLEHVLNEWDVCDVDDMQRYAVRVGIMVGEADSLDDAVDALNNYMNS